MIVRNNISDLKQTLDYFPVLGIVGPRQVGKTTLAKELTAHTQKKVVYVDLENPADANKLSDPVLFFTGNEDNCVILDEIQRMPHLFPVLRSMVDQNRQAGRFILLGSASPDLIRDSSESLAGRIAYEELSPFNLLELPQNTELMQHWLKGGFPNAFLAPSEKMRKKWMQNFVQTYVERDLPMLGLVIDRNLLRKLWTMTAYLNGNVLNMSNFSKSLEISSTTLKKYLYFLEDAFLVRVLQPFYTNMKKRLVKSPKIYVRDTGVLHYLLNIQDLDTLTAHPNLGNSWEGYVIEQIYQKAKDDYQFYFYRTHEGAECDLVLCQNERPIYAIEIKYTSVPTVSKGLRIAWEDLGAKNKCIITPKSDDYLLETDVRVCNLYDFLTRHI